MLRHSKETLEDIAHGQIVIVTARWIFVLSGWMLVLWQPIEIPVWRLQLEIVLLLAYTAGNFFLTIQWMKRSEALTSVVYASSVADLSLVTILVLALGGYESNLYVFYFPALFALAVTFPKLVTLTYTLLAMGAYGSIILVDASTDAVLSGVEAQNIVTRLILMGAVAFCANLYRSLEGDRRHGRGRMFEIFKATSSTDGEKP